MKIFISIIFGITAFFVSLANDDVGGAFSLFIAIAVGVIVYKISNWISLYFPCGKFKSKTDKNLNLSYEEFMDYVNSPYEREPDIFIMREMKEAEKKKNSKKNSD